MATTEDLYYLCGTCKNVSPTPSPQIPSWCIQCYEYSVRTFTKQELHDAMQELIAHIKTFDK